MWCDTLRVWNANFLRDVWFKSNSFITPEELQKAMNSKDPPIIIDVRSKQEYNESHIPNAIHKREDWKEFRKDEFIVVYCGVGFRSGKCTRQLMEMGYTNVHTLYGSFYKWVNEGREIVDLQGPVDKVFPHQPVAATYIRPEKRLKLSIPEWLDFAFNRHNKPTYSYP
jgi:rhodanese-related sulfurtransferase